MKNEMTVTALQRLPVYINYLKSLDEDVKYISSGAIARALGMGEVLVRKDLAFTSQGRTRVGYMRGELISALEKRLGCNDVKNAAIVGAGGLGSALLAYGGFVNYGINIVAAYDNDAAKIGTQIAGKPVCGMDDLQKSLEENNVTLAVLCVPAKYAQQVADKLLSCGIKAILNFAPVLLQVPQGAVVRNIDVAANLAVLRSLM